MFLATYFAYIPTSFILTPDRYGFKVLQSLIVFMTIIKINGYLRIFEDFGFLVQMITAAVRDSFDFIVYFLIILASFATQMSYLTTTLDFQGIGSAMFMIATIRQVLGDAQLVGLATDYEILFWIVWLLLTFIGQIVLMNFIIAKVGDSYK